MPDPTEQPDTTRRRGPNKPKGQKRSFAREAAIRFALPVLREATPEDAMVCIRHAIGILEAKET